MDKSNLAAAGDDPYLKAVSKLNVALTAVLEVKRLLNFSKGVSDLNFVEAYLRALADQIVKGNRAGGIMVALVDKKAAARVMGRSTSKKKLAQLVRARESLAQKRQRDKEYKMIRARTM